MGFNTTNKNGLSTTWGECGCSELRCIHWNNWSMDSIPRVQIKDTMSEKEKKLFSRYNDNCEATELVWIELEIQAMEREESRSKDRYRNQPNRMGIAGQWAYDNRKTTEELLGIDRDSEYVSYDNQGSSEVIRYDEEEINPFESHR